MRQVATLENAAPGAIAFLANERYLQQLKSTRAAAVIVSEAARGATAAAAHRLRRIRTPTSRACRRCSIRRAPAQAGIHRTAVVGPLRGARARRVAIGPHAVIGARRADRGEERDRRRLLRRGRRSDRRRHAGSIPSVTVYHGCVIGERVILHSGVVIGADGFGIALGRRTLGQGAADRARA